MEGFLLTDRANFLRRAQKQAANYANRAVIVTATLKIEEVYLGSGAGMRITEDSRTRTKRTHGDQKNWPRNFVFWSM